MNDNKFDLLSTVQYGGCSAKIPQEKLTEILSKLPLPSHPDILVDIETHDDAGVFRINETTALILTTDFFPPICSDPHTFGQIAAANALSDIYAMGGTALLALNLVMFPSAEIPMDVLGDILLGGNDKITEAGAFIMGGHTIEDSPVKYGLAVVGTIHPDKLITNAGARIGQKLILTKPLGTGVLAAAQRMGLCSDTSYQETLHSMTQLNAQGAELMQKYGVTGATDITGFGLIGHLSKMSEAGNVSFRIDSASLPVFSETLDLLNDGCIPGAAFRNLQFSEDRVAFGATVPISLKMLTADAQTSGGLLMAVDCDKANALLNDLQNTYQCASIIGEVIAPSTKSIFID